MNMRFLQREVGRETNESAFFFSSHVYLSPFDITAVASRRDMTIPIKWNVRPAKCQIPPERLSQRTKPKWADAQTADRTGRISRLI